MENFKFYTNETIFNVETKSDGEKEYFVTGYISTTDKDLVNDVVTDSCLDDMVVQIKSGNIKLDVEHESFKDGAKKINKVPIARIIDAKRDEKGIYVKALVNNYSPDFKSVWGSIKKGFLDAFSITYKALDAINKVVNGVTVRLLNKVTLLNVALTGNPVNPHATMDKVFVKSLEASIMTEELMSKIEALEKENLELKSKIEEAEKEEEKEDVEAEEKSEDKEESEDDEESKPEAEAKSFDDTEIKSRLDKLEAENTELKSLLNKPQFKSMIEAAPEPVVENKIDTSKINLWDVL